MTDTWGVGAVMACLLVDEFRQRTVSDETLLDQANQGNLEKSGFENFTKPLQIFLKACLAYEPDDRPLPLKLKYHEIFRNIN